MSDPVRSTASRKRARTACKQCRQAKVRCDSERLPCPRCSRLGKVCEIDSTFKRTSRRQHVANLERQVQRLQQGAPGHDRQQRDRAGSAASESSLLHASLLSGEAHQHNGSSPSPFLRRLSGELPTLMVHDTASVSGHWVLETFTVSSARGSDLFALFFNKYHPFLPMLDPARSPPDYYHDSPVLFWTIIAIAARQYHEDRSLLTRLKPALDRLMWNMVATNPTRLPNIQAMVLWACWPLPNLQVWTDPTLTFISIALTHAMQLGLHRPGFENDFSKHGFFVRENVLCDESDNGQAAARRIFRDSLPSDTSERREALRPERTRTWFALVATYQNVSSDAGHLPVFLKDRSVAGENNDGHMIGVPEELQHQLTLHRFQQSALQTVNEFGPLDSANQARFYETMARLETTCQSLMTSLTAEATWFVRLRATSLHLYLQLIYFLDDKPSPERQAGILRAYETASSLITDLIVGEEASYDLLPCSPLFPSRWIFSAALLLFRVVFSSYGAQLNRSAVKATYNAAAFAIRRLSVRDGDDVDLLRLPTRISEILRAVWRRGELDESLCQQEPTLRVKSRFGNNLIADCMRMLRDYRMSELDAAHNMRAVHVSAGTEPDLSTNIAYNAASSSSAQQADNSLRHASNALPTQQETTSEEANRLELFDPFEESSWLQDFNLNFADADVSTVDFPFPDM